MSTIFLVRHGQTALNAQGRFRGLLDPPLDHHGVEQAHAAARVVAAAGVDAVYASPLQRTMATARVIAEMCGLTVIKVPGLIDLDYGAWEGLTWEEATEADPEGLERFRSYPWSVTPPGGEPVADVAERVEATIARLADRGRDDTVVAVSHDLPIRLALAAIMGVSGPELWRLDVAPGSVIRLENTSAGFDVPNPPGLLDAP